MNESFEDIDEKDEAALACRRKSEGRCGELAGSCGESAPQAAIAANSYKHWVINQLYIDFGNTACHGNPFLENSARRWRHYGELLASEKPPAGTKLTFIRTMLFPQNFDHSMR